MKLISLKNIVSFHASTNNLEMKLKANVIFACKLRWCGQGPHPEGELGGPTAYLIHLKKF